MPAPRRRTDVSICRNGRNAMMHPPNREVVLWYTIALVVMSKLTPFGHVNNRVESECYVVSYRQLHNDSFSALDGDLDEHRQERETDTGRPLQDLGSSSFWTSTSFLFESLNWTRQAGIGCRKMSQGKQSSEEVTA